MLRWLYGWDGTDTNHYWLDWGQSSQTIANGGVIAGIGRFGGNAARFNVNLGGGGTITKVLDNQQLWVLGAAIRITAGTNINIPLMSLMDGGTNQCALALNTSLQLYVTRNGQNGTVLGTYTPPIILNTWYWMELKVLIDGAVGTAALHLNNAPVLALANVNTQQSINKYAASIVFGPGGGNASSGFSVDIDDLYILDGQGPTQNDFLNDRRVVATVPTGPGATTQSTGVGTGVTAPWQAVKELAPDDDTTYANFAPGTVGGTGDLYTYSQISAGTPLIEGIRISQEMRKDDAGAAVMRRQLATNGQTFTGPQLILGTTYNCFSEILPTNPATGAPWLPAEFNALQVGAVRTG